MRRLFIGECADWRSISGFGLDIVGRFIPNEVGEILPQTPASDHITY
jgi:hypothetical protein